MLADDEQHRRDHASSQHALPLGDGQTSQLKDQQGHQRQADERGKEEQGGEYRLDLDGQPGQGGGRDERRGEPCDQPHESEAGSVHSLGLR